MAQWLGQLTGLTHATRVKEAEAALRHAVDVLRAEVATLQRREAELRERGVAAILAEFGVEDAAAR